MEQYVSPTAELLRFTSLERIAIQVYDEYGSFGGETEISSSIEASEGFEEWN